jgi:hypothetical protein
MMEVVRAGRGSKASPRHWIVVHNGKRVDSFLRKGKAEELLRKLQQMDAPAKTKRLAIVKSGSADLRDPIATLCTTEGPAGGLPDFDLSVELIGKIVPYWSHAWPRINELSRKGLLRVLALDKFKAEIVEPKAFGDAD